MRILPRGGVKHPYGRYPQTALYIRHIRHHAWAQGKRRAPARRRNDVVVTTMQGDIRDKELHQKKEDMTTTCIPLRHLCCDFLLHLFSQKLTKCSHNPSLVNQFSATPQGQLNWTGPIASGSDFLFVLWGIFGESLKFHHGHKIHA